MKASDLEVFADYYDRFYLSRKDYSKEAEIIKKLITDHERRESKVLLDVGCGTGEHVKYLSKNFRCTGVDVNERMVKLARKKVPRARFVVGDMTGLKLQEQFDVVICLFGSIGYTRSFKNLVKAFRSFRKHLNDEGLLIVEPWVFKQDFKKGHVSLDSFESDEMKFVRMARSKLTHSRWIVYMHYLIGTHERIQHSSEIHELLAIDYEDYIRAFKSAGYKDIKSLQDNLWNESRGVFLTHK